MKTIIAGSRSITDWFAVQQAVIFSDFDITEVVSGGAKGADQLGERWAEAHDIPINIFKADWARLGKKAGSVRNEAMARYADALIAIWDGQSKGTANMIRIAQRYGLRVYVHRVGVDTA